MDEKDKAETDKVFTQLVGPMELDKAEHAFKNLLEAYVAEMQQLKNRSPWAAVQISIGTGRWMLMTLAQEIYGLTQLEAMKVVEEGVIVARHNLKNS